MLYSTSLSTSNISPIDDCITSTNSTAPTSIVSSVVPLVKKTANRTKIEPMIPVKRGTIFEAFGTSPPSKKKALTRTRSALNFNDFVASDYVKAVRAKFTAARKANGKTDAALASERAKLAKPFTYTYPKKKDTDTEFALSSWNVNSFRAAVRADFFKIFDSWTIAPDALFLQEIKATSKDLDDITSQLQTRGYDIYINSGQRAGYAGTALITKKDHKPLRIVNDYSIMVDVLLEAANGIDSTNTDKYTPDDVLTNVDVQAWDIAMEEGRIITAEYDTFYTVGIYTPNAGQKLERLKFRELVWEPMIQRYLHVLQNKKPVIYCGDLNSARTEYDIFSPDTNHFNAGFTKEERDALNALIGEKTTYLLKFNTEADTTDENKESMEKIVKSPVSANGTTSLDLSTLGCDTTPLFDAFTHMYGENLLHPYTFWGYRSGGRTQNKGWRLDYFIISKKLQNSIRGVLHDKEYVDDKNSRSSDHAPIHLLFQADKV